jgi:isopentenyl diphosphate isomerase/L-lactate dehydrogenase-like FMN-dependent dehydrogenase
MASEVLKVAIKNACSNTETKLIDGTSGHTYTVLSITICETAAAAETFDLYVMDDGGGTDNYIYKAQALGANETFEHTGRIVLEGTDHLCAATASSAAVDVVVSYLDQTL